MNKIIKESIIILLTGLTLITLDSVYLSAIKHKFELQIVNIQRGSMSINMTGVLLCYLLLTFGVYYFIIREHKSTIDSFLMGIFVYGIYETTNYAVFKKWSQEIVVIDTLWGGVLFALTNSIVYQIRGILQL